MGIRARHDCTGDWAAAHRRAKHGYVGVVLHDRSWSDASEAATKKPTTDAVGFLLSRTTRSLCDVKI